MSVEEDSSDPLFLKKKREAQDWYAIALPCCFDFEYGPLLTLCM